MTRLTVFSLAALLFCSVANAQTDQADWLNFRGDAGNGVSASATPPTTWSSTENVAWKKEIPGLGSSSPIVIGNRVIITAAAPTSALKKKAARPLSRREQQQQRTRAQDEHKFVVLCYDRSSGDLLWEKTATTAKPPAGHHSDNNFASASPVSDGEVILVNFGSQGLYCFDIEGNLKWKRDDLGKMKTRGSFGEGSSVAIDGDLVILPWDHEGPSRIEVINRLSGETIWKKERDEPSNWVTPRVAEVDGRKQIVQVGQNYSRGYDLATGDELWKASGMSQRPVSTPVLMDNMAFVSSARGGAVLQALRLDQQGDITTSGVEWTIRNQTPDIPSLLLSENRLFFVGSNKGILSCVDATNGKNLFGPSRIPLASVYSSPVAGGGKVFITSRDGKTLVINDAVTFERISLNDIGEPVDATLALSGNEIFIRGKSNLYCIRNQ